MAAKKNATKKTAKKPVYDSLRTGRYGANDREYGGGAVGGRRGMRSGFGTGESVSGNRVQSRASVAENMGGGTYGTYKVKTSDALVKPTVKKTSKNKMRKK